MPLPIPNLLPGELFFDYTVNQLWIGTLSNGKQQLPLDTLNGITFPDATVQTTAASMVTKSQAVNTLVPENLSIVAPAGAGTMYTISLYIASTGAGSPGSTYTTNISYMAADGAGTQVITLVLPLDSPNVVMETYPILVLGGSTVTSIGTFSGPASAYTISQRIETT